MAGDPRTSERVALCGWFTRTGVVELRTVAASVYPAQLIACGRPWIEPVCSAKIRHRKGLEVAQMIEAHWSRGGSVTFAVLTAGDHHLGEAFDLTAGVLRQAWTRMTRSGERSSWRQLAARTGLVGTTQALEITHGDGWHPHLNVLLWHDHELRPVEAAEVLATVTRLWREAIAKQGRYLHPVHGAKVIPNATSGQTGLYVAKVQDDWTLGAELARGDVKRPRRKGGRLPFTIAADHYRSGDLGDWQLWQEYSRGILAGGQRSIAITRHSPGLRARIGAPAQPALTDEQLAAIEVGGQLLAVIPQWAWRRVRLRRKAAELLAAAEAGGLPGLNAWLTSAGLPPAEASDPARALPQNRARLASA